MTIWELATSLSMAASTMLHAHIDTTGPVYDPSSPIQSSCGQVYYQGARISRSTNTLYSRCKLICNPETDSQFKTTPVHHE